jgi:DNA mismatch endonuclease (patch repair protein)
MQNIRRATTSRVGTKPEIVVASYFQEVGCAGVREPPDVEGKPDLYFPVVKLAIFVHGCFWHGHETCRKGRQRPKTNAQFWEAKIQRNRRRDARITRRLRAAGVHVYVVWECQLREGRPPARVINAVRRAHGR